jgi:hypothetical protein
MKAERLCAVAEHETFYEETTNIERKAGTVYWNRLTTLKRNNVQILYALYGDICPSGF